MRATRDPWATHCCAAADPVCGSGRRRHGDLAVRPSGAARRCYRRAESGGARRPLGIVLGLTVDLRRSRSSASRRSSTASAWGRTRCVTSRSSVLDRSAAWRLLIPRARPSPRAPARRAVRALARSSRGDGFRSGLLVGGALGFVYTPCAGPILAAVITDERSRAAARWSSGLAYALGTGLMLLVLALGGRRVLDRLRGGGRALTPSSAHSARSSWSPRRS
jgi:hypothetical protein